MVVRLKPRGGENPMVQIVLTNEDDIIVDSAKVKSKVEVLEVLAKWLIEYDYLHHDRITFYRL